MANGNEITTWDRGELITTIGPLSIFRTATAFTVNSDDGSANSEIQIEHRYTVRVDPEWVTTGGIVAFEIAPPYYAVTTGNRLDSVDSLVEFTRNADSDKPETTGDEGTFTTTLTVRPE